MAKTPPSGGGPPSSATEARRQRAARRKAQLHADLDYDDFYAYMPTHQYLYVPTRELWSAASIDARLPKRILCDHEDRPVLDDEGRPVELKASAWLDKKRHVEQMTWCPGKDMVLLHTVVSDGGWIRHAGATCYNLYRPPVLLMGEAAKAGPWLDHLRALYPEEADPLLDWFAHRVQRPSEKINHALVLGGAQGIGKDTILEPVKAAIGPWNMVEISPQHLMGRFNGFAKAVILRISEARDLGEVDRFSFYDHLKTYTAAPPDVMRVDEKNLREHSIFNVCGVLLTTNHKTGLYLDPDDRRHYVAWSAAERGQFSTAYFADLYRWFAAGGLGHCAAYLRKRDLSGFDAKRPPVQTEAWRLMVEAGRAPEDPELLDALESLGYPPALTLEQLAAPPTPAAFAAWLRDPKNRRNIPHRLEERGYGATANRYAKSGYWRVNGRRQVVYTKYSLSPTERQQAAQALTEADGAF